MNRARSRRWKKNGLGCFALLVLTCLSSACLTFAPGGSQGLPERAEPIRPAPRPSGDGLDSPWFQDLPGEAKAYLKTLAEAFRKQDRDFLVSQGEVQYEKEVRFRYDEEIYLALLYRAGPYSEDTPESLSVIPRLDYRSIDAVYYTDWAERGPLVEITGRLYSKNSEPVPCAIILVWRLEEPKILGHYP